MVPKETPAEATAKAIARGDYEDRPSPQLEIDRRRFLVNARRKAIRDDPDNPLNPPHIDWPRQPAPEKGTKTIPPPTPTGELAEGEVAE